MRRRGRIKEKGKNEGEGDDLGRRGRFRERGKNGGDKEERGPVGDESWREEKLGWVRIGGKKEGKELNADEEKGDE